MIPKILFYVLRILKRVNLGNKYEIASTENQLLTEIVEIECQI